MKEAAVCGLIIAVCALVYRESLKLPPGGYDPLGGGTMPRIVCVTIIVLCLVALTQIAVPAFLGSRPAGAEEKLDYVPRPGMAAIVFGLLVLYALSIHLAVPFALSTSAFLFATTMLLGRFDRRLILPALLISVAVGLALNYAFVSVFKVDLP